MILADWKIKEAYFKARGLLKIHEEENGKYLMFDGSISGRIFAKNRTTIPSTHFKFLPNILESYSAFKEHVLEVMAAEDRYPYITYKDDFRQIFIWGRKCDFAGRGKYLNMSGIKGEEMKDNNILHAAVIAATRYWEEKE